jgi:hypothetical protein
MGIAMSGDGEAKIEEKKNLEARVLCGTTSVAGGGLPLCRVVAMLWCFTD